jgi:uncharacterized protein
VTFAGGKFMPLFAMLFGAGFALQYDRLRQTLDDPRSAFRRRLAFLLVFGLLHGLFFYFGDITHTYAIAGFLLLRHLASEVPALARSTIRWWVGAFVWTLVLSTLSGAVTVEVESAAMAEVELALQTAQGGYWEQWPPRAKFFLWQAQANLLNLPVVLALMLTGMLAQRAGWLRDPAAAAWSNAVRVGLFIGLPAALVYGSWSVANADLAANLAMPGFLMVVHAAGLTLSFLYAAWMLRSAPAHLVGWLAAAGRMPLTNYLLQSVAMGTLLTGWGLGWGATLGYAQTSAVALAIFVAQVLASRWWLARHAQGPLEALWRRWTYGGAQRRPWSG